MLNSSPMQQTTRLLFGVSLLLLSCQKSTIEEFIPTETSNDTLAVFEWEQAVSPLQPSYQRGDTLWMLMHAPAETFDLERLETVVTRQVEMSQRIEFQVHQLSDGMPYLGNGFELIIRQGDFQQAAHLSDRSFFQLNYDCISTPNLLGEVGFVLKEPGLFSVFIPGVFIFYQLPPCSMPVTAPGGRKRALVQLSFSPFDAHVDLLNQLPEEERLDLQPLLVRDVNDGKRFFFEVTE